MKNRFKQRAQDPYSSKWLWESVFIGMLYYILFLYYDKSNMNMVSRTKLVHFMKLGN